MKKMINFFNKKKRVVEISSAVESDAVPDPPRNIPHYVSRPTELYKNFQIDYCGNNSAESTSTSNSIHNGTSEETLHLNGYDENLNNDVTQANGVEETTRPLENHLTRDVEELPVVCLNPGSGTVSDSDSNELNTTNDLNIASADSRSSPSNNMSFKELNDAIQKLSSDLAAKNGNTDKKNSGNTYVITISNSAHFHIGSQKTINYPDVDKKIKKKNRLELTEIKNSKLLPLNDRQVLDIKDTLSEEDMFQISLSVHEKWEDFARNLGIDESTIRELEYLYDNDYNSIVYNILRQYLDQYPNTTVGYMIDVLKRSNETCAIERLLENR